jgi:hypothetical protein
MSSALFLDYLLFAPSSVLELDLKIGPLLSKLFLANAPVIYKKKKSVSSFKNILKVNCAKSNVNKISEDWCRQMSDNKMFLELIFTI